jgi:hypothetical protein
MKPLIHLFLAAALAVVLAGCATTTNDAGVRLYKKPDLSKVAAGTPVAKVAALKNPIHREAITKGVLKGAEVWVYEWDAPDDEVNNRMFTYVVVRDGAIIDYVEDSPDKWRKDPKSYKAAKLASSWEDISGYMAQAARYQAAANMLANYSANQPRPRSVDYSSLYAFADESTYGPLTGPSASRTRLTPHPYGGWVARDQQGQQTRVTPSGFGTYTARDTQGNQTRLTPDGYGGFNARDASGNRTRVRPTAFGNMTTQ